MLLSYSFIVPVYNRPQEILELLQSFLNVNFDRPYEIVIIEDGSTEPSEHIVKDFSNRLNISYFKKENTGPGDSRNFGMRHAKGNYFIILDSDVLMPQNYLDVVDRFLKNEYFDCFGGADSAHDSFTPLQKAINYVMTSLLTTGGIRGNKSRISKFEPRSFNMGLSKKAFESTDGFSKIHPGEDPDLSHRVKKAGYNSTFIPGAAVFHKRRISLSKFHKQVSKFGAVRPILSLWHPESEKVTFWFPTFFIGFVLFSIVGGVCYSGLVFVPLITYLSFILLESTISNKSLKIGILSVACTFIQFFGYGWAFLKSTFYIKILKRNPEQQFPHLFFK